MPKQEGQKSKLVTLLRILEQRTDENHRLNVPQLVQLLENQGILAERKSIYSDIDTLRSLGYDIQLQRGRGGGYWMASRAFELSELKLLVDAVQSSSVISARTSKRIIHKLEALCSDYEGTQLQRQVYVDGRPKTDSQTLLYSIDALHTAINRGCLVQFRYKGSSAVRTVSPWQLAWENGCYYLIAYQDEKAPPVRHYRVDRMSGVRVLERQLGKLCRKAAMQLVEGDVKRVDITENNLKGLLGTQQYSESIHSDRDQVGVVNGLAWTQVGGEILEVEAQALDGSGKLELTGNLGQVMQESVKAAYTCLRSRAAELGIAPDFYKTKDIHVHFPEGAVPKDGPSAGVTLTTALISALSEIPVRHDLAMTGEITLHGNVLPIGGLKEKSMAAFREGISTVLIPEANKPDLYEVDEEVKKAVKFIPVSDLSQVLKHALILPAASAAHKRTMPQATQLIATEQSTAKEPAAVM